MPPLFFAVAAASSDAEPGTVAQHLALLPGACGWRSARFCEYPQELLLQLERGAEVHEVEVAVPADLAPRAVDIYLSRAPGLPQRASWDVEFEHAGTLEFPAVLALEAAHVPRRERLTINAQCSGQVRVLVHEPVAVGPDNASRQVALAAVELWGYHQGAAVSHRPPHPKDLGFHGGAEDVVRVLTDLGIDLSIIPPAEEEEENVALSTAGAGGADVDTRRLLAELECRRCELMKASRLGEAQQLTEHAQQLIQLGRELQRLRLERERLLAAGDVAGVEALAGLVRELEAARLGVAALYETDFWLQTMAMPAPVVGPM